MNLPWHSRRWRHRQRRKSLAIEGTCSVCACACSKQIRHMDCIWSFPWEPTQIMSTPPFPDHFWRQSNDVEIQSFVHGCFEGGEFYEFLHVQLDLDVLSKMVRRKTEPHSFWIVLASRISMGYPIIPHSCHSYFELPESMWFYLCLSSCSWWTIRFSAEKPSSLPITPARPRNVEAFRWSQTELHLI